MPVNKSTLPSYRVIILGAGRNFKGDVPSAITSTDKDHCVLDWLLDAFSILPGVEINFVAGYKAGDIQRLYPKIRYFYNPDWERTGPLHSLAAAELTARKAVYVCYADTVFRRHAIARMEDAGAGCVLAVDTAWRARYDAASRDDIRTREKIVFEKDRIVHIGAQVPSDKAGAQFAGLLRLSGPTLTAAVAMIRKQSFASTAKLSALVHTLSRRGKTACVDLKGDWAELDAPQDLARFVLGTKAESLARLKPLVRQSKIGAQVAFTQRKWQVAPSGILRRIIKVFPSGTLIVRSSALSEDLWQNSAAGAHQSIADVPADHIVRLSAAIDSVFASYRIKSPDDQIFVQRMLNGVRVSGVVMTRTPALGAPYYVFNLDDTSRRTDTVTSGSGERVRTITIHRDTKPHDWPRVCRRLHPALKEIERLVGHDALDIEFAVTAAPGKQAALHVHILQVRPIAATWRRAHLDDEYIARNIRAGMASMRALRRRPSLGGPSNALSVMADWNPAEMIGTKPNRLAMSLYRYLITDGTWAQQRVEYGYRDVRPHPLMIELLGHPYIDVRVDFNSFVPAVLPDALAHKLVDFYVSSLKDMPQAHDKVEFDIVWTAIAFDTKTRMAQLKHAGFSTPDIARIKRALTAITRQGMQRCAADVRAIDEGAQRFDAIMSAKLQPLPRAQVLLDDARGSVLTFAHCARAAFIAVGFLKTLIAQHILPQSSVDRFLSSLNTVSGLMNADAAKVAGGTMAWRDFVHAWGHLRPGTYDIASLCYAEAPEEFLRPMVRMAKEKTIAANAHARLKSTRGFSKQVRGFSRSERAAISKALTAAGLPTGVAAFEAFARRAIEGREWGKFMFTRHVNAALEAVTEFGEGLGFKRADLAHVRAVDLSHLQGMPADEQYRNLERLIAEGREAYRLTQAVCVPDFIVDGKDLMRMEAACARPNFVTQGNVRGAVIVLTDDAGATTNLNGKIVVVEKADPGFDWIFGRGLAGFITMYGGANSHMAIRAAEFGLPAAIGVGEAMFTQLQRAAVIELDCAGHRIAIIR